MTLRRLAGAETAEVASAVLLPREVMVDTDRWQLRIGDGVTPGGRAIRTDRDDGALDLAAFGVDLTGTNASSARLQDAVDAAIFDKRALRLPPNCRVRTYDTIVIDGPLTLIGAGCGGAQSAPGKPVPTASRLFFDHLGKGIHIAAPSPPNTIRGVSIIGLMTERPQPEPTGAAWTPIAADFDIAVYYADDVRLHGLMCFNATKAIDCLASARVKIADLQMQAFDTGIRMDVSGDIIKLDDVHVWPMWRDHIEVHRYALEHLDALHVLDVDAPEINRFFAIGARSAVRFSNSGYTGAGCTQFQGSQIKGDYCKRGLWFDTSATNTTVESIGAFRFYGSSGALAFPTTADRVGVLIEGNGTQLSIGDFSSGDSSGSAVKIGGTGNDVRIAGTPWLLGYGTAPGNGDPAFDVGSGNGLTITNPVRNHLPGTGPLLGGAGTIDAAERRGFTPGLTVQSIGTGFSAVFSDCFYRRQGKRVCGEGVLSITAAGTAAGWLRIGMPTAVDHTFPGTALNVATGEVLLAIGVAGTPGYLQLTKAGGVTAITTGAAISFSFDYLLP